MERIREFFLIVEESVDESFELHWSHRGGYFELRACRDDEKAQY